MHSFFRAFVLVATASLTMTSQNAEASRLFFSTSATSPTDVFVTETNPIVNMTAGQSVTVYIWYQRYGHPSGLTANIAGDVLNVLGLDLVSSNPIISRTGHTIDNPNDDFITGVDRWESTGTGLAPNTAMLIDDSNVVRAGSGSFFGKTYDPGRDPVTSAIPKPVPENNAGVARYGTLTLQALSAGSTQLRFRVGDAGISYVNASNPTDATNFGWGDAAIPGASKGSASTLADLTINVVPEPSSLVLWGIGAVGLVVMGTRRQHR